MITSPRFDDEALIIRIFEQARICYGDLRLDIDIYKQRLTEIYMKYLHEPPTRLALATFLARIHTDDLYLTTACVAGKESAWQRFDQVYRTQVYRLARNFSATADLGDELAGNLMADLFFVDQLNRPRIASYEGWGPLKRWLRMVISHRAENERERKSNHAEDLTQVQGLKEAHYLPILDAQMRAMRYASMIQDALRQASHQLSERERFIFLMKYDDTLSSRQIALTLGVQPPRITQLLQQIRRKIKQQVIQVLSQKYNLGSEAIEECLAELAENPEHSIIEPLKTR